MPEGEGEYGAQVAGGDDACGCMKVETIRKAIPLLTKRERALVVGIMQRAAIRTAPAQGSSA